MNVSNSITSFYGESLRVIDFVVSRTSDSLADILTKALPLVAPIPNAVSIYYVSQTALKYNTVQALAVAASVECMFFALTEVVLKSWDMWRNDKKTVVPLVVSVTAFVVYFVLIMWLVYALEVAAGHSKAPMAFPVVSVVAAVALGVTRWHNRNVTVEESVSLVAQLQAQLATVVAQHKESLAQHGATMMQLQSTVDELSTKQGEPVAPEKPTATQRRETLIDWLRNGVAINANQVASDFGVSAQLVRRELAQLRTSAQQPAMAGD